MNRDKTFEKNGITFVWNTAKAKANIRKHGIEFERAIEAFFDPFLKIVDAGTNKEVRTAIIGMDKGWNLYFVVHVEIQGNSFRIISARRATKIERRNYES